jgi:CheY-like chemotaxis protein
LAGSPAGRSWAGSPALQPGRPHVAVVEDTDATRKFLSGTLYRHGVVPLAFVNGTEAVDALSAHLAGGNAAETFCSLVITDKDMPQLGGLGVTREFRARGFSGPIILSSSTLTQLDRAEAQRLGVTETHDKPMTREQLRGFLGVYMPSQLTTPPRTPSALTPVLSTPPPQTPSGASAQSTHSGPPALMGGYGAPMRPLVGRPLGLGAPAAAVATVTSTTAATTSAAATSPSPVCGGGGAAAAVPLQAPDAP